jgi:hypothetical protein
MSVSSAPATARPARRGTLPVAGVCVAVVVAAIAGLLVGGSLGGGAPAVRPATAPQPIAHAGLRVQIPSGWARADVTSAPGFVHPLGLQNSDAGLRASVERLPATSATLLPPAFLHSLDGAPDRPAVVTLGAGRQAWRYRIPGQDSSMTIVYAAPTTSGIATIACTSPLDASVPRACDALARTVTVPGSRALEPSTSAAFFTRLPTAVTDLDAARAKGSEELSVAALPADQALAADGLARAHKAAGAALAPLITKGDGLPSATVGALTATATAYTALAGAARDRAPQPYADARRAVTGADADLRRTMTKVAAASSAATHAATLVADTPVRKQAAPTQPAALTKPTPRPAVPTKPAARTKPATDEKVAARTKRAADEKPAAVRLAAEASPAASISQGTDLTPVILALLGALMVFFAVRAARRTLR